jgi:hypothetical protein
VKSILDAVSPEHRNWLEAKLSFANEFSFPKRVRDLWKRNALCTSHFPMKDGIFSTRVSFIRNYFTHFKLREGEKPPEPQEVVTLGHYLKTLIEVSILHWLQMPSAMIESRAKLRVFEAPPYEPLGN